LRPWGEGIVEEGSSKAAKGANTRATWAIGVSIVSVLIAAVGLVVAIIALLKKVS
jgi:hypothetical protein